MLQWQDLAGAMLSSALKIDVRDEGRRGGYAVCAKPNGPARWLLDLLAWPLDGFPSYEAPEIWFLSALAAGFLVGWGVMVWSTSPDPANLWKRTVERLGA